MYAEHPVCKPPPAEAVLWRYMDFVKYVSLLDKQALFFERVDRLGDPFEGSLSAMNATLRPYLYRDVPEDSRKALLKMIGPILKSARASIIVNCWHENEVESDFMWRLYAKDNGGVAIKTTFDALSRSFTCSDSIFISRINYVDYDTTLIPERNSLEICLYKRKSFEHEREVRALTMLEKDQIHGYRDVDLSVLIEEVYVAPLR